MLYANSSNTLALSSNLYWNSTSNYLGINTSSPSNSLDVVGNVRVSYNITSSNIISSNITSSNVTASNITSSN